MKERYVWLDNLRVISTIAVILLHASAPILYQFGQVHQATWNVGNFYDGMVRFSVPVFFMLSGALLLSRDYELGYFLKNRFWRIVPPLVFWSLVYIIYDHLIAGDYGYSVLGFFKMAILQLLSGSKFHLWFVYTLLGLYLFIPILRKWIKHASNEEILYFLVIWVVTIIAGLPYVKTYFPSIPLSNFAGFVGYLVLGYYLSNVTISKKFIPGILVTIGTAVTVLGTYHLSVRNNQFSPFYYRYLSLNVLLSAVGVFLLMKNVRFKNERIQKAVSFLSDQSFGIFLVHVLVLALLSKIGISWKMFNPVFSIPLTTLTCLALSSIAIFIVRKIKYGAYISG